MTTANASSTNVSGHRIRVIGVPLDLGQSRRGVDMGPSAVRVAGLEARLEALGHEVEDGGNVAVAIPEQKKEGAANAKYLKEITATCTKHAELVLKTLEAGRVPLCLGGDHSMAAGTVIWRGRILSPPESTRRADLDRRPHRHQHSRLFSQRQCSRDAAGCSDGTVGLGARQHLRLLSQGAAGELCAGRRAGHRRRRERKCSPRRHWSFHHARH